MASAARVQAPVARWLVWAQGVAYGVLAALLPAVGLLLGVLLAPALLALLLDRNPGRPLGRAVTLFGLAGTLGIARRFWGAGADFAGVAHALTDPFALAQAWTAGAAGWLAVELAPVVAGFVLERRAACRAQALIKMRAGIEEEWGLPPRS